MFLKIFLLIPFIIKHILLQLFNRLFFFVYSSRLTVLSYFMCFFIGVYIFHIFMIYNHLILQNQGTFSNLNIIYESFSFEILKFWIWNLLIINYICLLIFGGSTSKEYYSYSLSQSWYICYIYWNSLRTSCRCWIFWCNHFNRTVNISLFLIFNEFLLFNILNFDINNCNGWLSQWGSKSIKYDT